MAAAYVSCKQASQLLDVSASTIKRLCDEGGLTSVRTPGGHRRISLRSIRNWQMQAGRPANDVPTAMRLGTFALSYQQCANLLIGCTASELKAAADRCLKRLSIAELCDTVLAPALGHLDNRFTRGETAAHCMQLACQRLRGLLFHLLDKLPEPTAGALCAVGAAMQGDLADIPSLMAELTLRDAGWQAESLGIGCDAQTLGDIANERQARLVWVTYSHPQPLENFVQHNVQLNARLPVGARLVIGGSALSAESRRSLTYSFFGDSFHQLRSFAAQLAQPNSTGLDQAQHDAVRILRA